MSEIVNLEPVLPRMPSPPRHQLPEGACDAHAHVFGPYDRFPPTTPSSYAPPLAPLEVYLRMLDQIGASRGVLVQPAPYGTDTSALCDALRRGAGRLRGIAVATADVADSDLADLQAAGVRGLRFVEMQDPRGGGRYRGSVGADDLRRLAGRMRELEWHAQIWASCPDCAALASDLGDLDLPLVFDHMACPRTQASIDDPSFQRILAMVAEGRIWVKLSLCRNSKQVPDYPDLRPFHDALVEANPDRLLWGSDFPFVRMGDMAPDVGHLLDLFHAWVDDAALRQRILVENPSALYGFDAR